MRIIGTILTKKHYKISRVLLFLLTVGCLVCFAGALINALSRQWDKATFNLLAFHIGSRDWFTIYGAIGRYKDYQQFLKDSRDFYTEKKQ